MKRVFLTTIIALACMTGVKADGLDVCLNDLAIADDQIRACSDVIATKDEDSRSIAYYHRAKAYLAKNNNPLAIDDFNQMIKLNNENAVAYNGRGTAYSREKKYDNAISDYNKAISINKNYAAAYNGRGVAYKLKGDYDLGPVDK